MNQQDTTQHYLLIREGPIFYRGDCALGNPEWTKKPDLAKALSCEEAILKQIVLKNKGWLIFVENLNKYLPITEV